MKKLICLTAVAIMVLPSISHAFNNGTQAAIVALDVIADALGEVKDDPSILRSRNNDEAIRRQQEQRNAELESARLNAEIKSIVNMKITTDDPSVLKSKNDEEAVKRQREQLKAELESTRLNAEIRAIANMKLTPSR